jgi:lactate dehydrogenase-like 2-hydroxyacid dehydrogenase
MAVANLPRCQHSQPTFEPDDPRPQEQSMPATVLVLVETINDYLPLLERQGFHLILAPTPAERAEAISRHSGQIDAVLTRGPLGLYADEIAALPNLKIICVIGAGYEQVDLQAAADRGLTVTNGAGVNASSVADHAMALLLSLVRDIPRCDAAVRRGEWPKIMRPSLAGKRLGILGLGAVGMAIAKRAGAGFDMSVSYHNRQHRSDVPYKFCSTPTELARASDFLIVATPGGLGTKHLINKQVLEALGPNGFFVNIARASVVVTADLISALEQRRIAGAALDVFDAEPKVPDALKVLANVILSPHVAGLSPEATQGTVELVGRNLVAFFSGQPVLTPIELPKGVTQAVQ